MAVGHGHSDGTQRLGASEEDNNSSHRAELFTWGFLGVSELLSYCHSFLYGCFCSSHTHTHLTDAQLSSNPCCSALTQRSPTQEERTKVWRCVLWNIWWDLQDVGLQIMMRRRWGDAAVHVTHMMMRLLLDLSSSPGWFSTMLTNDHAFFFVKSISTGPIFFFKSADQISFIKFPLILFYRNLLNCLFAKLNLEVESLIHLI